MKKLKSFRFSEEDLKTWTKAAKADGRSLTNWIEKKLNESITNEKARPKSR